MLSFAMSALFSNGEIKNPSFRKGGEGGFERRRLNPPASRCNEERNGSPALLERGKIRKGSPL
jgi:hypothetical protein